MISFIRTKTLEDDSLINKLLYHIFVTEGKSPHMTHFLCVDTSSFIRAVQQRVFMINRFEELF